MQSRARGLHAHIARVRVNRAQKARVGFVKNHRFTGRQQASLHLTKINLIGVTVNYVTKKYRQEKTFGSAHLDVQYTATVGTVVRGTQNAEVVLLGRRQGLTTLTMMVVPTCAGNASIVIGNRGTMGNCAHGNKDRHSYYVHNLTVQH